MEIDQILVSKSLLQYSRDVGYK